MASDRRQAVFDLLESAVSQGVFPGCVALVWRDGATLYHEAHGAVSSHARVVHSGKSATRDTVYDLASLTKVLGTTTLTAIAVSEGLVELDDRVPEPWGAQVPGATLADLLEHCSGLVAHREYFTQVKPGNAEGLLARIAATKRGYDIRGQAVYSDLGFIILGKWLEALFGNRLDDVFNDRIAYPLGLEDTPLPTLGYRRIHTGLPSLDPDLELRIAPTEVYDASLHADAVPSHFDVRKSVLCAHGTVHDDNAFVMAGVAGHAGLFGTAQGVLEVARAWALNLMPGLTKAVRDRFWQASVVPKSTRRLGFDGASPDGSGSAGSALGTAAIGHTGYTGTSVWIDPRSDSTTIFVLLSNRVHPVRTNDKIKRLRPQFHELASKL